MRARTLLFAPALLAPLLLLAACGNLRPPPIPPFTGPPPPMDFDRLATDPGVYAGAPVTLVGALSVHEGQACLADRNRRVAVRLTAEQAALYAGVQDWPVIVQGVFAQNLCPPGFVCPEFCTPYGLESGVRIIDPAR